MIAAPIASMIVRNSPASSLSVFFFLFALQFWPTTYIIDTFFWHLLGLRLAANVVSETSPTGKHRAQFSSAGTRPLKEVIPSKAHPANQLQHSVQCAAPLKK